jgi:hypothetical protein
MAAITYDAVFKLAEQLSPQDQQALVEHLQAIARQRQLSFEEWKALFDSIKDDTPIVADFSPRREDW